MIVPADFTVPAGLTTAEFRLEPLGPQHNSSDHAAWTSSIAHIRDTSGFTGGWPPADGMTLEGNLSDLRRHAADFTARTGFTYTVLSPGSDEVIGCVYIYPPRDQPAEHDVEVHSWVRADHAHLDTVLHQTVATWLSTAWPFRSVSYPGR